MRKLIYNLGGVLAVIAMIILAFMIAYHFQLLVEIIRYAAAITALALVYTWGYKLAKKLFPKKCDCGSGFEPHGTCEECKGPVCGQCMSVGYSNIHRHCFQEKWRNAEPQ